MFGWFKRRRRRKLLAQPFPEGHRLVLQPLHFYKSLGPDQQVKLHDITTILLAEKSWEGCGGLELTLEIQVVIAAQAALLILEIEHDYYRRLSEVLIYPAAYQSHEGDGRFGEAWYGGPVVLSWQQARDGADNPEDGHNVVFHEFAHKLDMLDGMVDGTPPLSSRSDYPRWTRVMTEAFEELKELARKGRRSVMDRYGATNEAEFFAVATETFFEKPSPLSRKLPELYDLLRDYYRQDPLARLQRSRDPDQP